MNYRQLNILTDQNYQLAEPIIEAFLKKSELSLFTEKLSTTDGLVTPGVQNLNVLDYNCVRVGFEPSRQLLLDLPTIPQDVKIHLYADSFFKIQGKWWPELFWFQNLRNLIVRSVKGLNNRLAGYVLGDGPLVQICAHILADLGFQDIYMVSVNSNNDNEFQLLQKKIIGIRFHQLSLMQMNLQSTNGSILINTLELTALEKVLDEIVYFNFLQPQSCIVDLHISNKINPLIREAELANFKTLSGHKVIAVREFGFLEKMGILNSWQWSDFYEHWTFCLKNVDSNKN